MGGIGSFFFFGLSVDLGPREMYFTLLTVDNPGDEELEGFKKMCEVFGGLVRFEISNEEL